MVHEPFRRNKHYIIIVLHFVPLHSKGESCLSLLLHKCTKDYILLIFTHFLNRITLHHYFCLLQKFQNLGFDLACYNLKLSLLSLLFNLLLYFEDRFLRFCALCNFKFNTVNANFKFFSSDNILSRYLETIQSLKI